jgi:hypothetical protein
VGLDLLAVARRLVAEPLTLLSPAGAGGLSPAPHEVRSHEGGDDDYDNQNR